MTMILRPAGPGDLSLLRRWDRQPHVACAAPNDDWNWEEELYRKPEWREQLIAELDGEPVGYVEIIDPAREDDHYWGDVAENLRAIDLWIGETEYLGRGYGGAMMRLALERCFANTFVSAVLVDPLYDNARARAFYERQGFRFVGRRRFGADDCAVYRLSRADYLADAATQAEGPGS